MSAQPLPGLPISFPAPPVFISDGSIEILRTIAGTEIELYISQHGQNAGAMQLAGSTIANNISDTVVEISQDLNAGTVIVYSLGILSAATLPVRTPRLCSLPIQQVLDHSMLSEII
jgi:hypothetical protein